ncbi:lipopolysaccharide biosynthesis protein [Alsobacter sp. SYSU BS001988]
MAVIASFLFNAVANFALGLLVARLLGPEAFGVYAVAVAGAATVTIPALDWIRHAATRFYSDRARTDTPDVRATLDRLLLCAGAVAAAGAGLCGAAGLAGAWTGGAVAGLAVLLALLGTTLDYFGALARALWRTGEYALLVVSRNALALAAVGTAAALTGDPAWTLAAGVAALAGAAALGAARLRDPDAPAGRPDHALARRYARYGLPLVAAGAVAMLQAFANRAAIAAQFGSAEAGQFALAYDISIRAVAISGTALDLLLLQRAVQAHATRGLRRAERQAARNMALILAVLAPLLVGYAVLLPDFEAVFAPPSFRGPFATLSLALAPGLACWAAMAFGLTPVFQISGRTLPLMVPAAVSLAVNLAAGAALSRPFGALGYAVAFSIGMAAGCALLLAMALRTSRRMFPRGGEILAIAVATLAMALAIQAARARLPAGFDLAAMAALGAAVYGAVLLAFDAGGSRRLLRAVRRIAVRPGRAAA